jgi:hypothetical protein
LYAHRLVDHGEDSVPVFAMDYCFLAGSSATEEVYPILVVVDGRTRWLEAGVLQAKGVQFPYSVKWAFDAFRRSGASRLIIRSDSEPPILALRDAVARLLRTEGVEVALEPTQEGQSDSNGLA